MLHCVKLSDVLAVLQSNNITMILFTNDFIWNSVSLAGHIIVTNTKYNRSDDMKISN